MTTTQTAPDAELELTEEPAQGWLARLTRVQALQIILVLIVLVVVFSIAAPGKFMTVGNVRNMVMNTSIYAVLGVGMTFVIVTAGIDLSIGSVLVFSSVMSAKMMGVMGNGQGWGVALVGLLVALVFGAAWGTLNGVLVAYAKVPPLIVTLGTLGGALGLALVITKGTDVTSVPIGLTNSIGYGNVFWQVPWLTVVAAVVVILGIFLLHRTRFGLHTFAVGSNPEAVRRAGINLNWHLTKVYMLMGLLAGFAGFLSLAHFATTTINGQSMTNLNVIAGVVIGGTSLFGGYGSVFGTVIGLFIPTVLQAGFVIVGIQPFWQQVVIGAVLIAAVWVDQTRRAAALRGRPLNWRHLLDRPTRHPAGSPPPQ